MRVASLGILFLAACTGSLGEPTVKPLPKPDPFPALLGDRALSPRIANYRISATFDAETRRISASSRLSWTNTGGRAVEILPFHLYMNAFKNEESVFMRESRGRHRDAEANQKAWGWIDVSSIRIDGAELIDRVVYPGEPDETVMEVPLSRAVEPGASIDIDFSFQVQMPEVFARTGYKGKFTMFGQWFPKIGVLTGERGSEVWHCKPFHLNSEFFADFGVYDVDLTVPDTHVVAATGVLTRAVDNGDGTRTLGYHAEDVHDFAWMADPYMKVMSATAQTEAGPVEVRVYYRDRQEDFARRHLHAGVGAIEHFSRLYVGYPWSRMSIIDPPLKAAAGAGGMEYPTLVTTAGDSIFMRPGVRLPEYVTVHEVGHNWFQGILASNEVDEAWLDEGVNEYADSVVMEAIYGEGASMIDWGGFRADAIPISVAARGSLRGIPAPIATMSYEFPDRSSYAAATYTKTAAVLRTLENIIGREAFRAAFRVYTQRFAFRHPTGEDLFATLENALGRDLRWYLDPAFHGVGAVEFDVRSIRCRRVHEPRGVFGRGDDKKTVSPDDAPDRDEWMCDVLVVNHGLLGVPVDVEIEFGDGTSLRQRWDFEPGKSWRHIREKHDAKVTRVIVDPDRQILVNEELSARDVRTESDGSASRRAGARVQFWTQTAMQVFGL